MQILEIENINGIMLEMAQIPSGEFMMGASENDQKAQDDEYPLHLVHIKSFLMGKYPVTQAQWRIVANLPKINRNLNPDPSCFKGDDLPVERVSWHDAVEFCDRVTRLVNEHRLSKHTGKSYRLPTEAEWEYACRAGTTTSFHFGETITTELANYNGSDTFECEAQSKYATTTPVGRFVPNAFGLYDMHANVWEWCRDYEHDDYAGAPTDGSAWLDDGNEEYCVLRGGSWDSPGTWCRSSTRFSANPSVTKKEYGFRVVCAQQQIWVLRTRSGG